MKFAVVVLVSFISVASGIPTSCMQVDPSERVDCGYDGMKHVDCLKRGCCFDNIGPKTISCYVDPDRNPCSSSPCRNGGKCVPQDSVNFQCLCAKEYVGTTCDIALPCSSSPCQHGGTCTNSDSSFTCQCAVGYIGATCADTDPCTNKPCKNGGSCTASGDSFTCQCATGYIGTTCEETPCSSIPCQHGGACTVNGNSYTCQCATGFSGPTCAEAVVVHCNPGPCQNGGTCVYDANIPFYNGEGCNCGGDFYGDVCDKSYIVADNGCAPPCENGGTCQRDIRSGTIGCKCNSRYTGETCQDAVQGAPPSCTGAYSCDVPVTCELDAGEWTCTCEQPFNIWICLLPD